MKASNLRRSFSKWSKKAKSEDINVAIQQLDVNKDCQVTLKDIYNDYKNFQAAYYNYQLVNPSEQARKPENQVEVDMSKFSMRQLLWDSFFYGNHTAPKYGAVWTFSTLAQILVTFLIFKALKQPYYWFYHWQDPLGVDQDAIGDEGESEGSLENSVERAKYNKRISRKEL